MQIIIAEDEASTRRGISAFLQSLGHRVQEAENGREAWLAFQDAAPDLVISDVKMPEMGGLDFLQRIRTAESKVPVLMMTAFATVEDAVSALKLGADDYLTKPLNLDELELKLTRLADRAAQRQENYDLKLKLRQYENPDMIGVSPALEKVRQTIRQLARDSDVPVVITGESGTGKELAARSLHQSSHRAEGAFVAVNCAAFQENLLESELFGHKKGAFTGAYRDKTGIFQTAHGGTLFLDEVSEMSAPMQSKLLRVLQEGVVQPVGGTQPVSVDVRIISASNRDLKSRVDEGRFREDLYYRLHVIDVPMPPLRERLEDIPLLAAHFIQKYAPNRPDVYFDDSALSLMRQHDWPGNVRELENLVRRLLATCREMCITAQHLPEVFQGSGEAPSNWNTDYKTALSQAVARFEIDYLDAQLRRFDGNISRTAQAIGLSRVSLHQKIKQHGIDVH